MEEPAKLIETHTLVAVNLDTLAHTANSVSIPYRKLKIMFAMFTLNNVIGLSSW